MQTLILTSSRKMMLSLPMLRFTCRNIASHSPKPSPVMSSQMDLIRIEQSNGLRKITMIDNKTRNSLSLKMMSELIHAIEADKSSSELRCIAITNENSPVFSAGHNLKELTSDKGMDTQKLVFSKSIELALSIKNAEVPVISVVKGLAAASGCQLVASCDFAIATDKSQFSTPGASFGIFCSTPGVPLSRVVPRSKAAFMVLTGVPITAQEALIAGLVAKVVPESEIDECLSEVYGHILSKSRSVIKLGKKFFHEQLLLPYEEALRQGGDVMVKNLQMTDSQEGLQSFKEKRNPKWSHQDN